MFRKYLRGECTNNVDEDYEAFTTLKEKFVFVFLPIVSFSSSNVIKVSSKLSKLPSDFMFSY